MNSKHTDEEFVLAFQQATNICHLLKILGLSIYGSSYRQVRDRAKRLGLTADWLKPSGELRPRYQLDYTTTAAAVARSKSLAEAMKVLGIKQNGGAQSSFKKKLKSWGICTKHFMGQGWSRGKTLPKRHTKAADYLTGKKRISSHKLKKKLFNEQIKDRRCENCNRTEWCNTKIPLELHHIDGDNTNNSLENLQILCPNCHALTDNYRGKRLAVDH